MNNKTKTIIASTITLAITACGGGGSSSGSGSAAQANLKGTAIDGYIQGATVFLDVNYNGKLDGTEPKVITGDDGEWDLLITGDNAECSQYVPLVVNVPVGAIDSDYGEVTEAYQMTYPPSFAIATDKEIKNTTPLTTVVWGSIQKELHAEGEKLTCNNVKASYEVRERIKERLEEQERRVAQRYNVTVDELYGDYIAEDNNNLHAIAAALVPSMKASYRDTVAIEAENPNAIAAWVEYFKGDWDERGHYAEGWYKQTYLNKATGWSATTEAVTDNLKTTLKTVDFYRGYRRDEANITYEWIVTFRDNNEANDCKAAEWIEQTTDTAYGVRNVFTSTATTAEACESEDWSNLKNTVKQELTTRVKTSSTNATSQHYFASTTETGLGNLVMVDPSNVNASELDGINFISTDFNNTNDYGAYLWSRILMEDNPTADLSGRTTMHSNTGTWSRTLTYTNGTYSEQCSYDGGANWIAKVGDTCER
ncbi:hypothetical protein [Vibrio parahaemolyticus]|uniref:hypothetical protein n=1 Tax=Vibrio parahaemolyticus TaxID=670 RepID=UPI001FACB8E8|nr:hypothetical protein [Vibrio parahaemolyticus]MCI9689788.1 hypothetical protein [Vibrio parahaemolyticus]